MMKSCIVHICFETGEEVKIRLLFKNSRGYKDEILGKNHKSEVRV